MPPFNRNPFAGDPWRNLKPESVVPLVIHDYNADAKSVEGEYKVPAGLVAIVQAVRFGANFSFASGGAFFLEDASDSYIRLFRNGLDVTWQRAGGNAIPETLFATTATTSTGWIYGTVHIPQPGIVYQEGDVISFNANGSSWTGFDEGLNVWIEGLLAAPRAGRDPAIDPGTS